MSGAQTGWLLRMAIVTAAGAVVDGWRGAAVAIGLHFLAVETRAGKK